MQNAGEVLASRNRLAARFRCAGRLQVCNCLLQRAHRVIVTLLASIEIRQRLQGIDRFPRILRPLRQFPVDRGGFIELSLLFEEPGQRGVAVLRGERAQLGGHRGRGFNPSQLPVRIGQPLVEVA